MKNSSKIFQCGLLLSIIFHFSLIFIIQNANFNKKKPNSITYKINVNKEKDAVNPRIEKEKVNDTSKQIVETVNQKDSISPEEKRLLSEKNNSVRRETVAKIVDKFQVAKKQLVNSKTVKQAKLNNQKSAVKKLSLSNLGIGLPAIENRKVVSSEEKNNSDQRQSNNGFGVVSSSNDFLKVVPKGDLTELNTVEYKHFGFYQRIKKQLEQYWGTNLKEKASRIYKSGRKIATQDDFITNLEITLNTNGKIIKIKVVGASGVKELDDAAIDSFNSAGPFPNPPQDLLSKNKGEAIIKWGFVVKT